MNKIVHSGGWLAMALFTPALFAPALQAAGTGTASDNATSRHATNRDTDALSTTSARPADSGNSATARQEEVDTDTVIVSGTRLPGDIHRAPMIIDLITRDDPVLATASSWEDVLAQQPGVHVSGSGRRNGQTLSMRGFGNKGVLVRMDGIRQDIDTGHLGNAFLDPALIKEVQIARGALSSLYGGNAMGGVISLTTVDADDLLAPGESSGARLSVSGATGAHEAGAQLTLFGRSDAGTGDLDGLLALGYRDSGDIRRAGGDSASNDAQLASLLAKGGWQLDTAQRLEASWQHYAEDSRQPSNPQLVDVSPSSPEVDRKVTSDNLQLAHLWTPSSDTQWETRLSLSRQDIDDEARRTLTRYGLQSDGYQRFQHGWLNQTLVFGAELEHATQDPSSGATGFPDSTIDTAAIYLDDTLTVGHYLEAGGIGEFDLGLGLRYDSYRASDDEDRDSDQDHVSPKIRLSWRPNDAWVVYSGYAEAFRAPSLNELYATDRHFSGFCAGSAFCVPDNYWIPNPDLDPETSHTWESGFSWQSGGISLRGSYFDTRADDFIDTSVDLFAGTTQAVNVNRAHLWGYDLRLGYQPRSLPALSTFAALSEVSGKDRDSGEGLKNQTPLETTLGADWHFASSDLTVGWRGRFAQDFDGNNDTPHLPGYGLNDLQLAWQPTTALSTSLRLANVADQEWYRPDGSLGEGRSLLANISYQW